MSVLVSSLSVFSPTNFVKDVNIADRNNVVPKVIPITVETRTSRCAVSIRITIANATAPRIKPENQATQVVRLSSPNLQHWISQTNSVLMKIDAARAIIIAMAIDIMKIIDQWVPILKTLSPRYRKVKASAWCAITLKLSSVPDFALSDKCYFEYLSITSPQQNIVIIPDSSTISAIM